MKKLKLNKIILTAICLTIGSCKRETNVEETKIQPIDIYSHNFSTKPKFFLKYWSDMTTDDVSRTNDSLIKNNVIITEYGIYSYVSGENKHKMKFNYDESNNLTSITLTTNLDEIYPVYAKKYNLKAQILKNLAFDYYEENNPEYSPLMTYKIEGKSFNLPKAFNDNSMLINNTRRNLDVNTGYRYEEYIFPEDKIVIENENNVIVFEQKFTKQSYPDMQFSLNYNDRARNAEYAALKDIGIFYFINNPRADQGITEEHYSRNSKLRKVKHTYDLEKTITYIPKIKYELDQMKQKNKKSIEQEEQLKKEKTIENRINSVKNEL